MLLVGGLISVFESSTAELHFFGRWLSGSALSFM